MRSTISWSSPRNLGGIDGPSSIGGRGQPHAAEGLTNAHVSPIFRFVLLASDISSDDYSYDCTETMTTSRSWAAELCVPKLWLGIGPHASSPAWWICMYPVPRLLLEGFGDARIKSKMKLNSLYGTCFTTTRLQRILTSTSRDMQRRKIAARPGIREQAFLLTGKDDILSRV